MPNYRDAILAKVKSIGVDKLTVEERAVMAMLWPTFDNGKKVTQTEIARTERWLGCHPKHEADIRANKLETTTRQVRQIINDLRNKFNMPILSNEDGYWICRTQDEASAYLERLEKLAKASAAAFFTTYKSMKEALNTNNQFFESLEIIL